jgi:hypothetical protein
VCSVIRTLSQVSHSCCKIADALIETRQGGDEVEQIQRFRTGYRQYGMYGPPPCRKRKVRMDGLGLRKCIRSLCELKLWTLMGCAALSS